jgi:GNAT superfamily N-acetyltransferase
MDGARLRTGTPEDAGDIARTVALAFERYREIAPESWAPPPVEPEPFRARLGNQAVWCGVAEVAGEMAGHVALIPASFHSSYPVDDPSLAQLWQLFVREKHWGSGIATSLHDAVLEEALRRDYSEFRLYTPAAQGRARGFYEREGWRSVGEAFVEPTFGGMELIEYRRPLAGQIDFSER